MGYRSDEVKVGFVLILSILILLGFIIVILGIRFGQEMVRYTTSLKYVAGIGSGRVVRFGGMEVGEVKEVKISDEDSTRIEMVLEIEKGIPIRTDSAAFINNVGFVGEYYLEISTGSIDAPLLPPGGRIEGRDVGTFNELMTRAQDVVEKLDASLGLVNEDLLTREIPELRERLETTAENLDRLLIDLDEIILENRESISQVIGNVAEIVQENREEINATVENLREASRKLNAFADTLGDLVADNREDLNNIISAIRSAAAEAERAAERVNSLVTENADDFTNAIENLESTSLNFRNLSEDLADQPWRLLWRSRPPERQVIEK